MSIKIKHRSPACLPAGRGLKAQITRGSLKKYFLARILTNQKPNLHELLTETIRVDSIKIRADSCQIYFFRTLTLIFLLITSYWLMIAPSYAAPCYGTKMPERNKFFAGLQSHAIFKRHLEAEYGKVRSMQHFLLVSYGVWDWLCIDLKGGAGNIKQHPVDTAEIDYSSRLAGGYGLRFRLWENDTLKMVLGFQHISVHPTSARVGDTKHQAILDDWQWSLLASYNFRKITTYLGTRWSRVDYIHRIGEDRKRRMSDLTKDIGLILGLDFPLTEKIWLNLEGSAFDSEACSLSINYSF